MIKRMLIALALVGCKRFDDTAQALEQMDRFATAMCACKDKACADKISEEMARWGAEMSKHDVGREQPSPEVIKQASAIAERLAQCMTKAVVDNSPHPTPQ